MLPRIDGHAVSIQLVWLPRSSTSDSDQQVYRYTWICKQKVSSCYVVSHCSIVVVSFSSFFFLFPGLLTMLKHFTATSIARLFFARCSWRVKSLHLIGDLVGYFFLSSKKGFSSASSTWSWCLQVEAGMFGRDLLVVIPVST